MPDQGHDFEAILRSAGFSSSGIDRIKLGSGVVGKMTSTLMGLYIVCFACVAAGAYLNIQYMVFCGIAAAFFAFLFGSVSSMWFAKKYPAVALLEGGELVKYRQIEMATRDLPVPASQPNTEPPLIEGVGEER